MLKTYKFKCCCEACTNNYEIFALDTSFTDPCFEQKFPEDEYTLVMTGRDLELTSEFFDRACNYMKKYGMKNYYSVAEIHMMYFSMLRCLTVALDCRENFN